MADDSHSKPGLGATLLHPIRLVLIGAFAPAFPLCIAHGAASGSPVPAVGIVPLFLSFASSLLVVRFRSVIQADAEEEERRQQLSSGGDEESGPQQAERSGAENFRLKLTHPITIFVFDTVLAAALMVVLVFTWIFTGRNASLSMLAAYTTIPLLIAFSIHLFLAVKSFYEGLALQGLFQWAAWRAVPPDCPSCNVRLRPSLPELPWVKSLQRSSRSRRSDDYAPVLANDEEPYRDDVDEDAPAVSAQPEAVDVRRKDRKGKNSSVSETTPWE